MALVLVWLHSNAIKTFRDELSAERESHDVMMKEEREARDRALKDERLSSQEMWKFYMDLKVKQHEQVMTALVAQDRILTSLVSQDK